ncbi:helix-turn-helix transcriptional regulator [Sphingomonas ginkgonis]|uniref:Helix-turn-helix transcriptional regulator n=1 Tax=Sphingomonas ginkgonis TaxID=2315330 RepID=A0A3R9WRI4_9SPHN|nr:S24 family peptidase [Sphingomonas ginkgonis]RST31655.1 helix-turn-helix transcriptional regulator [Sphingomonas ginkgonis]
MPGSPRDVLNRLCAERGEDFAGLSRLIGRNPAYIQQFVKRGVPKRLDERDRRTLARYFDVPETLLGAPEVPGNGSRGLIPISRIEIRASAGPGAYTDDEAKRPPYFAFDERWLRNLTGSAVQDLTLIRVEGDSMASTLADGDDILIDQSDGVERLRDGIYVLRLDEALMVKRLAIHPVTRRITVQSDNPAYADWPDCSLEQLSIIGRVIWAARRIA